jgi:uncharacterized membrane-anchored protein
VTIHFWAVKVLTTALGEAISDYLVHTISPYIAVGLGAAAFAASLAVQLGRRRYQAPAYWTAVAMVAVFGTMCADAAHIVLGFPYWLSAVCSAAALAVVFAVWRGLEGTLSIHSIVTLRRELLYWAAVLATFAMGTAVGDLTAYTLHLGFLFSGLLFSAVFAAPFVARRPLGLGEASAFWFAYVITRPLGASYADWMGVPQSLGGLGFGRGTVSIALAIAFVVYVALLTLTRADVEGHAGAAPQSI